MSDCDVIAIGMKPCPCGGKPKLSISLGPLSGAMWHSYYCSNRYITGCRLIVAGDSRDPILARKKWNTAIKKHTDQDRKGR